MSIASVNIICEKIVLLLTEFFQSCCAGGFGFLSSQ